MVDVIPTNRVVPFARLRDVQAKAPGDDYLSGIISAYQLAMLRYQDFVALGKSVEAKTALQLARDIFDLSEKPNAIFPEVETPCDKSPSGQCEYDARRDPERCIHCGRKT